MIGHVGSVWPEDRSPKLLEVDLATGTVQELHQLDNASTELGRTPEGWLVSGGWGANAWLWMGNAERSELIRPVPGLTYLERRGDTLLAASTQRRDATGEGVELLEVPLERLRSWGATAHPTPPGALPHLARTVLDDLELPSFTTAFETADSLDRVGSALDRLARAELGHALPTEPAAFDHLVQALADQSPGPDVWGLLSVQLVRVLVEHGARFVPGPPAPSPRFGLSTPFARGTNPLDRVANALFDSEGDWSPADGLIDRDGRQVVLSVNGEALAHAVATVDETDVEQRLDEAGAEELAEILARWPENEVLESTVWRGLLARGRFEVADELGALRAVETEGSEVALRAWLAARTERAGERRRRLRKVTEQAWAALQRYPDDGALLLILAHLFEHNGDREGVEKAKACFRRILDRRRWGQERKAAEDGLERLRAGD